MNSIILATSNDEYAEAAKLFKEYAAWLNIDLSFQKFDDELLQLNEMYAPPHGGILLYKQQHIFIGCVAIRRKDDTVAELKRMYVKPRFQKLGIGNILLKNAISRAKELGYKQIVLDTLDTMTTAINLYTQAGFYKIEPYYFNPEKNAVFFEKIL